MIKNLKKLSTVLNKNSFSYEPIDNTNENNRQDSFKRYYNPTPEKNNLLSGKADQEGNNYFQSRNNKSKIKSSFGKL